MKQRFEGPAHELSPEEMWQLRTFLIDVQVVVGFYSHDESLTALEAVDDDVRPVRTWREPAVAPGRAEQLGRPTRCSARSGTRT